MVFETDISPQVNVSNSNRTALAIIRHYKTLGLERARKNTPKTPKEQPSRSTASTTESEDAVS